MKRGDIKRFREHLNAQDDGESNHKHGAYHQLKRKYGDYLYAQDREKFMVDLEEWLKGEAELAELRREISEAKRTLNRPQSYGAQVIGFSLKHIAEKFGKVEANKAIVELGLEKCGWKQET